MMMMTVVFYCARLSVLTSTLRTLKTKRDGGRKERDTDTIY